MATNRMLRTSIVNAEPSRADIDAPTFAYRSREGSQLDICQELWKTPQAQTSEGGRPLFDDIVP